MKREGLYSFQKNYEPMSKSRKLYNKKTSDNVVHMVENFIQAKEAREQADEQKRYLLDLMKGKKACEKQEDKIKAKEDLRFALSNPYELQLKEIKK